MKKCTLCEKKYKNDDIILLAEWEMGFGKIEDYYLCIVCYEITEDNNVLY